MHQPVDQADVGTPLRPASRSRGGYCAGARQHGVAEDGLRAVRLQFRRHELRRWPRRLRRRGHARPATGRRWLWRHAALATWRLSDRHGPATTAAGPPTRHGTPLSGPAAGDGQPYPRPPWGVRPGYPVRPPPYRPPVMVDDEPRARPRRPVMIAQPPVRQLRPLRLQRPAYAAPAAPVARPPTARPVPPPPVAATPDRTHVDREVLVEVSGAQPAGAIDRIAAQKGPHPPRFAPSSRSPAPPSIACASMAGAASTQAVDDLVAGRPRAVGSAQPRLPAAASDQGQAYYPLAASQYAATKLRLVEAHRQRHRRRRDRRGHRFRRRCSHPELQGAIGAERRTRSRPRPSPIRHGTAIAGAIGARGPADGGRPKTRIIAIRAFAPANGAARAEGTSWDIVRAVDLAAKSGAKVVNMSFAGPADRLMSGANSRAACSRGIVYVAAAGNGGAAAAPAYPAAEPGVIAVTATETATSSTRPPTRGPT